LALAFRSYSTCDAATGTPMPCRVAFTRREEGAAAPVASDGAQGWIVLAESTDASKAPASRLEPLPAPGAEGGSGRETRGRPRCLRQLATMRRRWFLLRYNTRCGAPCWLAGECLAACIDLEHQASGLRAQPWLFYLFRCRHELLWCTDWKRVTWIDRCVSAVWMCGLRAQPSCDPKHKRWLHLRIRSPQQPPRLGDLGVKIPHGLEGQQTKRLADGRWTLAFADEQSCRKAQLAVMEEIHVQGNAVRTMLEPVLGPLPPFNLHKDRASN